MKTNPLYALISAILSLTILIAVIISCNKKFDAPPAYIPPVVTATASIQQLKNLHVAGAVDSIATDMIIGGVVIANDSSGNFYKQIVLQDSTGGIAVSIDDYNLYSSFPVGRKVYVKMKGLYMSENDGLLYIGSTPDNGGAVSGIASRLKETYLVKGEMNVPVMPAEVTIDDVKSDPDKYMYTLVRFTNFEVKATDTAKTYAYASGSVKKDDNITVKSCSSDTIIIRTSGFSNFANINVPNGNGTLTAVYAFYKSPYNNRITPQLVIRDTTDVQFTNSRCNGNSAPVATFTTIKEIRAMYTGRGIKLGAYQIGGVVISEAANKNVSPGVAVLQDEDRGISVYFGGTVSYNIGDSIVLDITGDSLIEYRGSLEIKTAYGTEKPMPVATGKMIAPIDMTIQQLNNALSDIEFTMVKINNATVTGAVYSGNQNLTDATGNLTLYTSPSATFAGTSLPTEAKDWVGYGSFYSTTAQFQIRNLNDVKDTESDTTMPAPPPANNPDLIITEYVEGSSNNKYLEIYNAGTETADLSRYRIKMYANGKTVADGATSEATLDTMISTTTLAAGGFLVLQTSTATLTLPAGVITHNSSVCNFNGDDALTLEKDGIVIDVFGTVGTDPGDSWTVAGDTKGALDKTVRRKTSIVQGNTDWISASANEWILTDKDDVSNLGTR